MNISTILAYIDNGYMALPEFQRGYVWNREQVRGLFDSLYRRHPVGGLLVWSTESKSAAHRGDSHLAPGIVKLLLDGQQRMTTLYGVVPPEKLSQCVSRLSRLLGIVDIDLQVEDVVGEDKSLDEVSHRPSSTGMPKHSPTSCSTSSVQDALKRAKDGIDASLNMIDGYLGLDHDRVLFGRFAVPVMVRYLDQLRGPLSTEEFDILPTNTGCGTNHCGSMSPA